MTTITVARPLKVEAPRGARVAAQLALSLLAVFDVAMQALAERRQHSARVSEANRLRRLAQQVSGSDPRMAVEMLAAADRHELTR